MLTCVSTLPADDVSPFFQAESCQGRRDTATVGMVALLDSHYGACYPSQVNRKGENEAKCKAQSKICVNATQSSTQANQPLAYPMFGGSFGEFNAVPRSNHVVRWGHHFAFEEPKTAKNLGKRNMLTRIRLLTFTDRNGMAREASRSLILRAGSFAFSPEPRLNLSFNA